MSRWDDAPLVGRDEELARLLEHVERAAAGRYSAVLLAGDAGVGKTRLLDELGSRATESGLRVLTGHCVDLGDVGLPYLPFVDLLRPVAADPELAPSARGNPVLGALLAGRALPERSPVEGQDLGRPLPHRAIPQPGDDGRLQLFESVAHLLCELASAAPLVVVLEDLHWADRSSRDLLRYLLARLADEPILVIASYRSEDLHRRHPLRPLLAELVRLPAVERIDLSPLAPSALRELARGLAGEAGTLSESALDDVVARAEGNAFFAEELVAAGVQGEALPWALADVLMTRVEQRSPAVQQVLRVAAVAGRSVRHEWLAGLVELGPAELEQALAEAVHHHLLVVSDDGRYRFRHALLREAVLADLLPGEAVRLHAGIADYLARHPGAGTAAERAHHARGSNDLAGALGAALEAAEDAHRVGAPAEQVQHLESALSLWSAVPGAEELAGRDQAALLFETAVAARAVGELPRGVALLRSALEVLGPGGDPVRRARVHYMLAQAMVRLDLGGAYEESAAALRLVPADPPSEARTWAAATHARISYAMGLLEEADATAEEALASADALGLDSAWADTAISQTGNRPGEDIAWVRGRLEEARLRAGRAGDVDVEMRALFNLAAITLDDGRLDEVLELTARSVERARERGMEWAFYPVELRHFRITALYMAGRWDESLAEAEQLARMPDMAAHLRAASLLVLVGRGDPSARERLDWARALIARLDSHVWLSVVTAAAEIDLAAWAGDPDTALPVAQAAGELLRSVWATDHLGALRLAATALAPAADAASAARLVGDTATAEHWVRAAEPLVELARSAVEVYVRAYGEPGLEGKAWEARVLAEAARLRGEGTPELWVRCVEGFGFGHVYEQARSRWRLAEALLGADDRAGAAEQARLAHEVAVRLGAAPLRAAVEALVVRGRLDVDLPGVRAVNASAVLTPREQSVLALLAQGRTNRQIGAELYISEKTASVHVSNILAKLGANGRTEAVAIAAQRGLLSMP